MDKANKGLASINWWADLIKLLEQVEEWPIIQTIKGVGPVTAGIILGQTGSFKNYSNYKKIEKLVGLDLIESNSGLKEICKRGRNMLCYALYLIETVEIAKNKEIQAVYLENWHKERIKCRPSLLLW